MGKYEGDLKIDGEKLFDCRFLKDEKEFELFEEIIFKMTKSEDIQCIKYMFLAFEDETEMHEGMFGLIHSIEYCANIFGDREVFTIMIKFLSEILPYASEWVRIIHVRILNHQPSREIYAETLLQMEDNFKEIVIKIMKDIAEKKPEKFKDSVNDFLNKLEI